MIFINDPALEILIIAAGITLLSFIVRKLTTDQDKQDHIQKRSKELQKEYNEALKSGDQKRIKAAEEQFKELNSLIGEMFKDNLKPLMYTAIPLIAIFMFIKGVYDGTGTVMTLPLVGWDLDWFWWYFISAIISSMVFENVYKIIRKKVMKNETQ